MITKKRDQRQYDLVQQYLPGLILNTVLGIIRELGDPYDAKPGLGGMTAYPPMAMAAVCIMPGQSARPTARCWGCSGTITPYLPGCTGTALGAAGWARLKLHPWNA